MQQAPHSPMRIQQQEAAIKYGLEFKPLPELVSVSDAKEHVIRALNNFSTNILPTMLKDKLANISAYKEAQGLMPNLTQAKGLRDYRQKHPSHDPISVSNELGQYGLPLTEGQILFHGGIFPTNLNQPTKSFLTNCPLSTTLCAQVAAVHSLNHEPKNIWLIRVTKNSTTKAVVYSNDNRQTHSHETEILIGEGASIILNSTFQVNDFTIYEVELK